MSFKIDFCLVSFYFIIFIKLINLIFDPHLLAGVLVTW